MSLAQIFNRVAQVVADTANVANGATFTGAQFSTANAGVIVGTLFADQAGNLFVDQSSDGTNYDTITTVATTASNTGANSSFSVAVVGQYARIRWTNTSVTTTTIKRLYAFIRTI